MTAPACRFCGNSLDTSFADLGVTPLANSYLEQTAAAADTERAYPLHARVCGHCFLVQVDDVVPAEEIFSDDYAYFSSFSESWLRHARDYTAAMTERFGLGPDSLVIEVASNDGYLLRNFVERNIPVLGIDPAGNVARAAMELGVRTKIGFFDAQSAAALTGDGIGADLIAANNVFAHVPDIRFFAAGFPKVLKHEGVATFEFPHLLNLMRGLQFDTIYHEHYSYLSLLSVEKVLDAVGMRVFDVEELPTHGGSLRVFACHAGASFVPATGLAKVRQDERDAGLDRLATYRQFAQRILRVRDEFRGFLSQTKADGATVAAYGAAAKGNTFLNYCGVSAADIAFVVDRNPAKQDRLMPGSHIPILAPEALARQKPDFVVVLPWNLRDEITHSMAHISEWGGGGRFVTAVPEIRILEHVLPIRSH